MEEFIDEQYLSLADELGNKELGLMCDDDLIIYHSDEDIKRIKINRIKSTLSFYKRGIEYYKRLTNIKP